MGEVVSRVIKGGALDPSLASPSSSEQKAPELAKVSANPAQILRLVVDNATQQGLAPVVETWVPKMNRVARERVFRSLVSSTLDNPKHPYYSLVSPTMRQAMIDTITSTLTDSHYLA